MTPEWTKAFTSLARRAAETTTGEWSVVYASDGHPIEVHTTARAACGTYRALIASPAAERGEPGVKLRFYDSPDPEVGEYVSHSVWLKAGDVESWMDGRMPPRPCKDPRVAQLRAAALLVQLRQLIDDDLASGAAAIDRMLGGATPVSTEELMSVVVALRVAPEHVEFDRRRGQAIEQLRAALRREGMPNVECGAVLRELLR